MLMSYMTNNFQIKANKYSIYLSLLNNWTIRIPIIRLMISNISTLDTSGLILNFSMAST